MIFSLLSTKTLQKERCLNGKHFFSLFFGAFKILFARDMITFSLCSTQNTLVSHWKIRLKSRKAKRRTHKKCRQSSVRICIMRTILFSRPALLLLYFDFVFFFSSPCLVVALPIQLHCCLINGNLWNVCLRAASTNRATNKANESSKTMTTTWS